MIKIKVQETGRTRLLTYTKDGKIATRQFLDDHGAFDGPDKLQKLGDGVYTGPAETVAYFEDLLKARVAIDRALDKIRDSYEGHSGFENILANFGRIDTLSEYHETLAEMKKLFGGIL